MTTEQIVILVLSIALAAALVCAVVLYVRYRAEQKKNAAGSRYADEVIVKDGVRYSADPSVERGGAVNVSHAEGDFVLAAGKTYRAQKDGELLPGTPCLLPMTRRTRSNCAWAGSCAPFRTATPSF